MTKNKKKIQKLQNAENLQINEYAALKPFLIIYIRRERFTAKELSDPVNYLLVRSNQNTKDIKEKKEVAEFFVKKLAKYDYKAYKYIYRFSSKNKVGLYDAAQSMWNFKRTNLFDIEGNQIWTKGGKYVYLNSNLLGLGFFYCGEHVKVSDSVLHHPNLYRYKHYESLFSSVVIAHKGCHKK